MCTRPTFENSKVKKEADSLRAAAGNGGSGGAAAQSSSPRHSIFPSDVADLSRGAPTGTSAQPPQAPTGTSAQPPQAQPHLAADAPSSSQVCWLEKSSGTSLSSPPRLLALCRPLPSLRSRRCPRSAAPGEPRAVSSRPLRPGPPWQSKLRRTQPPHFEVNSEFDKTMPLQCCFLPLRPRVHRPQRRG